MIAMMKLANSIFFCIMCCTCVSCCVEEYHQLEEMVVKDTRNLDNLTIGFLPPNLQPSLVVEIFYHVNGTPWDEEKYRQRPAPPGCASFTQTPSTSCRTNLNLCAAYNNANTSCTYHFRWSFSSIYLFMEPRLLSDFALNYLPGTEIRIQQIHLAIPEICDSSSVIIDQDGSRWERGVLMLNKLTTFLRSYGLNRQGSIILGIRADSQGYATFCDAREKVADNFVVEHKKLYFENLIATGVSLGALAIFATLAAPYLMYKNYNKIYSHAKKNTRNFLYLLWSVISLCVLGDYLLSFLLMFHNIQCWAWPHFDSTYKPLFTGAIASWVSVAVVDLVCATFIIVKVRKTASDFPVPDLIRYITCHFTLCPCIGKAIKNTYFIQVIAVWHVLAALQIACFHAVFIFLAFIAQPLHTALTMIFYIATVFCLTTTFMLLYASFHVGHYVALKREGPKKFLKNVLIALGKTLVFVFFSSTIAFFGFTFLRITVFVGDTESGRIPSLVGSLLPSVLIALLGFVAKKLLDSYNLDQDSEESSFEGGDKGSVIQNLHAMTDGHVRRFDDNIFMRQKSSSYVDSTAQLSALEESTSRSHSRSTL